MGAEKKSPTDYVVSGQTPWLFGGESAAPRLKTPKPPSTAKASTTPRSERPRTPVPWRTRADDGEKEAENVR